MYKLMLSDLDETLLVKHHVPAFNVEAIKKARNKGLKFVPATGRAFNMIPEILQEIDAYDKENEYSICFNGGLIVENKNSRILNFKGLSFEVAKMLFEKARKYDVCVLVFTIDMCYIFNADEDEVKRKTEQKAPFKVIDEYNIDILKDEKIAKLLYERRDMAYLKAIEQELKDEIKDKACASYSSNRYLEFNALGVDKGYGLRWLANYLGIDNKDTIAIGDNYNDVEMIKQANLGVSVACASDDIKEISQYVTKLDYDQGAVKEVIEKFVLEEE
ncbi:MAG: Cof-type HAD-IIB family hydrolase [Thomasclavelia sp.]